MVGRAVAHRSIALANPRRGRRADATNAQSPKNGVALGRGVRRAGQIGPQRGHIATSRIWQIDVRNSSHLLGGDGADRADEGNRRPSEAHRVWFPNRPRRAARENALAQLGSQTRWMNMCFKRAGWIEPDMAREPNRKASADSHGCLRFEGEERVRSRSAKVDCGHRFAEARRPVRRSGSPNRP